MAKKAETIRENANKMRAEIIAHSIDVEDILTEALGNLYVYPKQPYNLINDIIVDLTFAKKINIFSKFVKEYSQFFTKHPTIIRDLHEVREKRNIIAHRALDIPFFLDETELDKEDYDYLSKKLIEWRTSCEFVKGGKSYSFTLTELEEFKVLCVRLMRYIHTGFVSIISPEKH